MSNIITIGSENSKRQKGDGVNAVLTLMKDLRDFQDKVESCIEAQAIAENKAKVEKFYEGLDKMAEALLEIAESGIKSKRKLQPEAGGADEALSPSNANVALVNAPIIPRIPR